MSNDTPQAGSQRRGTLSLGAIAAQAAAAETPAPSVPPVADEDPRARAERRAAELRKNQSEASDTEDKFYIDPRIIPDGWSYEWKRVSTLGKEDPAYQVQTAVAGWEPVPAARHAFMMPEGQRLGAITREGMILCERPLVITEESKARALRAARAQMRGKEEQLGASPSGHFERSNKGTSMASVSKSFEHVPIPEK